MIQLDKCDIIPVRVEATPLPFIESQGLSPGWRGRSLDNGVLEYWFDPDHDQDDGSWELKFCSNHEAELEVEHDHLEQFPCLP